jgi:hypothetical protein
MRERKEDLSFYAEEDGGQPGEPFKDRPMVRSPVGRECKWTKE